MRPNFKAAGSTPCGNLPSIPLSFSFATILPPETKHLCFRTRFWSGHKVTHFDPWLSSFIDWTTTVSAVIFPRLCLKHKSMFHAHCWLVSELIPFRIWAADFYCESCIYRTQAVKLVTHSFDCVWYLQALKICNLTMLP